MQTYKYQLPATGRFVNGPQQYVNTLMQDIEHNNDHISKEHTARFRMNLCFNTEDSVKVIDRITVDIDDDGNVQSLDIYTNLKIREGTHMVFIKHVGDAVSRTNKTHHEVISIGNHIKYYRNTWRQMMKRIVRIDTSTTPENKPLVIITNATTEYIKNNISTFDLNDALEFIAEKYYVRQIYNPETDPVDDVDAIGWDERYDEHGNRLE